MAWLKRSPYWFFEFYRPFTIGAEVLCRTPVTTASIPEILARDVELPDKRGIGVLAKAVVFVEALRDRGLRLLNRPVEHRLVERSQFLAHLHGVHLHLARPLQLIHPKERSRSGFTTGQEAVVTQDHVAPVAERSDQPLAFAEVDRDALEIVIRNLAVELRAVEIVRGQSMLRAGDRHAFGGMGMHDVMRILARRMNRRMNREAWCVHRSKAAVDDTTLDIDLDEIGRGDLAVHQAELIDQEMALRSRNARGDVIVDQLGPAEHVADAIECRQVFARDALLQANMARLVLSQRRHIVLVHCNVLPFVARSFEEIRLFFQDARVERLELKPAAERRTDDVMGLLRRFFRYYLQRFVGSCRRGLRQQLNLARAIHGDEPPGARGIAPLAGLAARI